MWCSIFDSLFDLSKYVEEADSVLIREGSTKGKKIDILCSTWLATKVFHVVIPGPRQNPANLDGSSDNTIEALSSQHFIAAIASDNPVRFLSRYDRIGYQRIGYLDIDWTDVVVVSVFSPLSYQSGVPVSGAGNCGEVTGLHAHRSWHMVQSRAVD